MSAEKQKTNAARAKAMCLLIDAGQTLKQVGEAFGGLSRERVRQIITKAGGKTAPRKGRVRPQSDEFKKGIADVNELVKKSCLTVPRACKKVGIDYKKAYMRVDASAREMSKTLSRILAGERTRARGGRKADRNFDIAELQEVTQMTQRELAGIFGLTQGRISTILKDFK